jgi:hypothetical protein
MAYNHDLRNDMDTVPQELTVLSNGVNQKEGSWDG